MKKYDLILKGARVLDPSRNMDGAFDVAVKDGKISGLEKEIPAEEGEKVLDVSGYLLTSGLVDMHCHIYPRFPFEEDGLPTIQGVGPYVPVRSDGLCGCRYMRRPRFLTV